MKKDRKELRSNRTDYKGLKVFWEDVQEAILDGYRFDATERHLKDMPRSGAMTRVVLFKVLEEEPEEKEEEIVVVEDVEDEKEDEVVEEDQDQEDTPEVSEEALEGVNSKKDLLEFAKEHGIDIPEDLKHHKKIKAYIKTKLS